MKTKLGLAVLITTLWATPLAMANGSTGIASNVHFKVHNQMNKPIQVEFSYKKAGKDVPVKINVRADDKAKQEIADIDAVNVQYAYAIVSNGKVSKDTTTCSLKFDVYGKQDHTNALIAISNDGKCTVFFK